ncbi:MAG: methyltransferase [Bacteroidaceae bacterium]|nr:methyltransferase [Bacteroidaceae bacterium]
MEFEMIAKTFQGLENVLAEELTRLGANNIQVGRRMVSYTGNQELLYRSNFCLRTAIRVLKPIKHFRATSADEVYEAVKSIDWAQYLGNEQTFAVDSVVYSTEFRHSKFVAYKVKDAIVDQFRERTGNRPNIRLTNPDIQLNMHIAEYDCTLSLDSSGESLHRRGYRQEAVEAPLNEVLAAGIILMTGWRGQCDFIDPMCGSGTLPIEATLIARNMAPGLFRKGYAFEKWADFDRELFEQIYNDDSQEVDFQYHVYGYDNNRAAIAIAERNVKAAALSGDITIAFQDFADFTQPANPAVIVTNPPYGERIKPEDLLGLYKMIGAQFKKQFVDNEAWVLSYREECFDAIGLKPSLKVPLYNGALECELRKYQMFSGRYNELRSEGKQIKTDEDRRQMAQKHRFKERRAVKQRFDESDEEFESRFRRPRRENREADDRPRRFSRDRNDRSRRFERDGNERPKRFGRSDDSSRSFDRGDRPRRFDRDDRKPGGFRKEKRDFREGGRDFRKGNGRGFNKGKGNRHED